MFEWIKSLLSPTLPFPKPQPQLWAQRLRAISYGKEFLDEHELNDPDYSIPAIPDIFCGYVKMDLLTNPVMLDMVPENKLDLDDLNLDKDGVIICSRTSQVVVHLGITDITLLRHSERKIESLIKEKIKKKVNINDAQKLKEIDQKLIAFNDRLIRVKTSLEKIAAEINIKEQILLAKEWFKFKYLTKNVPPETVFLKELELKTHLPALIWEQLSSLLENENKKLKARRKSTELGSITVLRLIERYPALIKSVENAELKIKMIKAKLNAFKEFSLTLLDISYLERDKANEIFRRLTNLIFEHENRLKDELSILRVKINNIENPTIEVIKSYINDATEILNAHLNKYTKKVAKETVDVKNFGVTIERILSKYKYHFELSEIHPDAQIILKYIREDALRFHIEKFVSSQEQLHELSTKIQIYQDDLKNTLYNNTSSIDGVEDKYLKAETIADLRHGLNSLKHQKIHCLCRSIKTIKSCLNVDNLLVDKETYDVLLRQQDELNSMLSRISGIFTHKPSTCITYSLDKPSNTSQTIVQKVTLKN